MRVIVCSLFRHGMLSGPLVVWGMWKSHGIEHSVADGGRRGADQVAWTICLFIFRSIVCFRFLWGARAFGIDYGWIICFWSLQLQIRPWFIILGKFTGDSFDLKCLLYINWIERRFWWTFDNEWYIGWTYVSYHIFFRPNELLSFDMIFFC